MSQVKVKITATVITAQYGVLESGSILRTTKEFADHLVKDCGAAEYETAQIKKSATEVKAASSVTESKVITSSSIQSESASLSVQTSAQEAVEDKPAKKVGRLQSAIKVFKKSAS